MPKDRLMSFFQMMNTISTIPVEINLDTLLYGDPDVTYDNNFSINERGLAVTQANSSDTSLCLRFNRLISPDDNNYQLFEAVHQFILDTKRFD